MTTPPPPSARTLRLAYRHLYKAALAAVQYTTPERYSVRDKLRTAFRFTPVERFHPRRIQNTLDFLNNAAENRGLEHKIVKNLCFVHYYNVAFRKKRHGSLSELDLAATAYNSYLENLGLLNESMDLDLR